MRNEDLDQRLADYIAGEMNAEQRRQFEALLNRDAALREDVESLQRTLGRLAALPGGGGTPLASGLLEALTLAHQSKAHGMTPCIILLTDGRANISLDGTADRPQASADSEAIARQIIAAGIDTIVLDLGKRPAQFLADLSAKMGGSYLPLPRADSQKMSGAVSAILAD